MISSSSCLHPIDAAGAAAAGGDAPSPHHHPSSSSSPAAEGSVTGSHSLSTGIVFRGVHPARIRHPRVKVQRRLLPLLLLLLLALLAHTDASRCKAVQISVRVCELMYARLPDGYYRRRRHSHQASGEIQSAKACQAPLCLALSLSLTCQQICGSRRCHRSSLHMLSSLSPGCVCAFSCDTCSHTQAACARVSGRQSALLTRA